MSRFKDDPEAVLREAETGGDAQTAAYQREVIAKSGACNPDLGPKVGGSDDPIAMSVQKIEALIAKDAYEGMLAARQLDNRYGIYTTIIIGAATTVALNEDGKYSEGQVEEAKQVLSSLRR